MAITGLHTLLYSSEVDAFRAVMRDVFEFPHVAFDNGFMIFDCPPATMEPHPGPPEFDVHSGDRVSHEVGFVCDEIEATVAESDMTALGWQPAGNVFSGKKSGRTRANAIRASFTWMIVLLSDWSSPEARIALAWLFSAKRKNFSFSANVRSPG